MYRARIGLLLVMVAAILAPACVVSTASLGEGTPPGYISGDIPANYRGLTSPFAFDDQAARLAGERAYFAGALSCGSCHGGDGRGYGPLAPNLDFGPADFAGPPMLAAFREHQDYVFWWVSESIPESSMPAFKERLSDTERWQVIMFAWSLGEQAASQASQGSSSRGLRPSAPQVQAIDKGAR